MTTVGSTLAEWLGPATQRLLDLADIGIADRVLDLAAGKPDVEDLVGLQDASCDVVMARNGFVYGLDGYPGLRDLHRLLRPGGRIVALGFAEADANPLFSIPMSIIWRRARSARPSPAGPSPYRLGGASELQGAYREAGFERIDVHEIDAPLRLSSAAECVRLERESFRGLHQMMAGLSAPERSLAWSEIEEALAPFDGPGGFVGPCRLLIAVGVK